MTFELWTLVYLGFLTITLGFVVGVFKIKDNQIIAQKNFNRDDLAPLTGIGARCERSLANLYENLPIYSILILLLHILALNNDYSFIAAAVFVVARTLHPIFYIAGIPVLRSGIYLVGLAACIVLALQLGAPSA